MSLVLILALQNMSIDLILEQEQYLWHGRLQNMGYESMSQYMSRTGIVSMAWKARKYGCESISQFLLRTGTDMEVYEIWDMILEPVHV